MKSVAKLQTMSLKHCIVFYAVFASILLLVFLASLKAEQLLIYNTGDSYTCTQSFNQSAIIEASGAQDVLCSEQMHKDGNIWLSRVHGLGLKNQFLIVYGYVERKIIGNGNLTNWNTIDTNQEVSFELRYTSKIRAKNFDQENFEIISDSFRQGSNSYPVTCKQGHTFCAIVLAAQINVLKYQTYDVYVELLNTPDEVPSNILSNINFKMAYVNPRYTDMQIALRTTFLFVSLAICIAYLYKICRGVPRGVTLTSEQGQLVWISISLVLFNDPTYLASIYRPSLFTSVISQLWVALFFVMLMKFWLRAVEIVKDSSQEQEVPIAQNPTQTRGIRRKSPLEILKQIYFLLLLLSLLSLYTLYELNLDSLPQLFSRPQSLTPQQKGLLAVLITTVILILLYLGFYLITLIRNLYYIRTLTVQGRGVFLFGLGMLIVSVVTVCFGVYSGQYENGRILVFFLALCNVYVWALIYLNWPSGIEGGNELNQNQLSQMPNGGGQFEEIEMQMRFERPSKPGVENRRASSGLQHIKNGHSEQSQMEEEEEITHQSQISPGTAKQQIKDALGTRDIHIDF